MDNGRLARLKRICPLPVLLGKLGLQAHAKPSCQSPLRADFKPSWGIYKNPKGAWFWKDHGTGEGGDEIAFLARHLKLDQTWQFREILGYYEKMAAQVENEAEQTGPEQETRQIRLPDRRGYHAGTDAQLESLSLLRGFDVEALRLAQDRGNLVFGFHPAGEVYGIIDKSGSALELRRLDGKLFSAYGPLRERKSHSVKHSLKSWPVGISEAGEAPMILLCEGVPDFLAGWQLALRENALNRVAVAAMLGASSRISKQALPYFKDKAVRIVPHQDKAGIMAAGVWSEQLKEAGAAKVDFIDLGRFQTPEGEKIKDLDDFKKPHSANVNNQQWRILQ